MEDINHVVSFSGGRSSARLVFEMERKRKENGWNVEYIFMDTGAEHPETYKFIREMVKFWCVDLTCIRVKYSDFLGVGNSYEIISVDDIGLSMYPWEGMLKKYGTPSVVAPYCTSRMKIEPHKKYCDEKYGKGNYKTWLGIRSDEPNRLKRRDGFGFLADILFIEKQDVIDWFSVQDFDLGIPEHLGNCVFCIKKGINKVALAAKDEPDLASEFIKIVEISDDVRTEGRVHNHRKMYRQSKTLSEIIQDYSDIPRESIFSQLRGQKRDAAGSCSESCEAFQFDLGM